MQYTPEGILSDFLIFFKSVEVSMVLYNGKKPVAQPSVVVT